MTKGRNSCEKNLARTKKAEAIGSQLMLVDDLILIEKQNDSVLTSTCPTIDISKGLGMQAVWETVCAEP